MTGPDPDGGGCRFIEDQADRWQQRRLADRATGDARGLGLRDKNPADTRTPSSLSSTGSPPPPVRSLQRLCVHVGEGRLFVLPASCTDRSEALERCAPSNTKRTDECLPLSHTLGAQGAGVVGRCGGGSSPLCVTEQIDGHHKTS